MLLEEMCGYIESLGEESRLPVWSFSYNRAGKAPYLETLASLKNLSDINLVVRESQEKGYRRAYPWARIHLVDDILDCVGYSRQAALDFAADEGHELILLVDDDLTNTSFLHQGAIKSGANAGKPCSTRTTKNYALPGGLSVTEAVLIGMSGVAREVHDQHPRAVLGGAVKQHGSFGDQLHRTMYRINGGVTPKQLMAVAPVRLKEHEVELDVGLFGRHGDDIGLIAEILKAGLQCWCAPSFTYDVWSEDQNIHRSVVRNPSNARELHAEEWDALQQYPIKNHLRVKRSFIDGSFEWADVNWRSYNKSIGLHAPTVPWPLDEARDIF